MKVAFVNQPFDEPYGDQKNSIALWSYRAAKELVGDNDVSIFCSHFGKSEPVKKENITYHGFDVDADNRRYRFLRLLKIWYRNKKPLFATPWYYSNYYKAIAYDLGQSDFDVVHIHNFPQVVEMVRSQNSRSSIVLHMHCDWLIQLHRPWIEKVMEMVDLVIGCSDHVVDGVARAFPEHAAKCKRLYNGFDSEGFYVTPKEESPNDLETPYLLYLGRGSPEKGLHMATRAFSQIAEQHPNLKLVCVGGIDPAPKEFLYDLVSNDVRRDMAPCFERPYREYVFEGISDATLSRITEISHLEYDKLVGLYQNATALLTPTVCHEAFGMPVLEAIACGTPIVASRCGGIPEFFRDGVDGHLFDRGDLSSLVSKLESILTSPVCLRSDEERQNSLTFLSWKTIVSELRAHYESLLL